MPIINFNTSFVLTQARKQGFACALPNVKNTWVGFVFF